MLSIKEEHLQPLSHRDFIKCVRTISSHRYEDPIRSAQSLPDAPLKLSQLSRVSLGLFPLGFENIACIAKRESDINLTDRPLVGPRGNSPATKQICNEPIETSPSCLGTKTLQALHAHKLVPQLGEFGFVRHHAIAY